MALTLNISKRPACRRSLASPRFCRQRFYQIKSIDGRAWPSNQEMMLWLIMVAIALGWLWPKAAVAEENCLAPQWYQGEETTTDHSIVTFAQGPLLSEAIKLAENKLWINLYDQKERQKLTSGEMVKPLGRFVAQMDVDKAVGLVFRWATTGIKRERRYQQICRIYYLSVTLEVKDVPAILFDRAMVKEYVYFVLSGMATAVKEELNWQYFWRRQGLAINVRATALKPAKILANSLRESRSPIKVEMAEILTRRTQQIEALAISLYTVRNEVLYHRTRQSLLPKTLQFDQVFAAAKLLENSDETDGAFTQLNNLAQAGEKDSFFLVGLLGQKSNSEESRSSGFKWLAVAKDLGDTRASDYLIKAYIEGIGTKKNHVLALSLLEKQFDDKSTEPLISAGELLLRGQEGLTPDRDRALGYFTQASERGDARGSMRLGQMYLEKDHQDFAKARSWFEKARDQGETKAIQILNKIAKMTPTSKGKPQAKPKKPAPAGADSLKAKKKMSAKNPP